MGEGFSATIQRGGKNHEVAVRRAATADGEVNTVKNGRIAVVETDAVDNALKCARLAIRRIIAMQGNDVQR